MRYDFEAHYKMDMKNNLEIYAKGRHMTSPSSQIHFSLLSYFNGVRTALDLEGIMSELCIYAVQDST